MEGSALFQGARPRWSPLGDHYDPASFDEATLRALWQFRLRFMHLKPHVDPEVDLRRFSAFVRSSAAVWVDRAGDGAVRGMLSYHLMPCVHEGREVTVLHPEYGFVAPDRRRSPRIALSLLFVFVAVRLRWPRRPLYIFSVGYLSGFLAFQELVPIWLHDGAGMTPWERSLRARFSALEAGWDPATGNVDMPTIPREPRTEPPRDPARLAARRRYLAQNPRWTEGIAVIVFSRVDATVALTGLRIAAARGLGARLG